MSTSSTGLSHWEQKSGGSPIISVDETAKLLDLGRNQVYAAVKRGEIDALRIGKRILILRAPLERMLRGEAA
ncbi:MAG: DNA-binding protein [Rhodospirillaceae bacterium]|nr:DNA-binding protein [Rhodospirillaceae bacterium]